MFCLEKRNCITAAVLNNGQDFGNQRQILSVIYTVFPQVFILSRCSL